MTTKFRIATYNIEWFTKLFRDENQLDLSDEEFTRYKVTKRQQAEAIASVLTELDADLICIVEAPDTATSSDRSTVAALEHFASHFGLRTTDALTGYISGTQQEIALLYDPNKVAATHRPQGQTVSSLLAGVSDEELRKTLARFLQGRLPDPPSFDSHFVLDVEEDGVREIVRFSRSPLEALIELRQGANTVAAFQLVGVHTKSKVQYGPEDKIQSELKGLSNRRKMLGQCRWLRDRVDALLEENGDFVLLGDFNDGPGLDFWERQFGRSGVEIVMGDYDDAAIKRNSLLQGALLDASDHFPVSVELTFE